MTDDSATAAPAPQPGGETREQRAWYFYDWANSAYVTAAPDDRDKVSSTGWGFGYLGGGLLLALNFGLDIFGP